MVNLHVAPTVAVAYVRANASILCRKLRQPSHFGARQYFLTCPHSGTLGTVKPAKGRPQQRCHSVVKLMWQACLGHPRAQGHSHNLRGRLHVFVPLDMPDVTSNALHPAETGEGSTEGVVRHVVRHTMYLKPYLCVIRVEDLAAPILH